MLLDVAKVLDFLLEPGGTHQPFLSLSPWSLHLGWDHFDTKRFQRFSCTIRWLQNRSAELCLRVFNPNLWGCRTPVARDRCHTAGGTSHHAAAWVTSPSLLALPGWDREARRPPGGCLCWAVPARPDPLPPALGAALALGSWFRRLLCIVEEGELNSTPQCSLCSAIIRLQGTYNLNSSSSQSLKWDFAPAPRFVPARQSTQGIIPNRAELGILPRLAAKK